MEILLKKYFYMLFIFAHKKNTVYIIFSSLFSSLNIVLYASPFSYNIMPVHEKNNNTLLVNRNYLLKKSNGNLAN